MVAKEQLLQIAPKITAVDLEKFCDPLNAAMQKFDINSPARIAAFIAQIAHESGSFSAVSENLNYSAKGLMKTWPRIFKDDQTAVKYAHKPEMIANYVYGKRNGNIDPGDGWKFRGRGLIGITFKDNYKLCGEGIGADLLLDPSKLELPLFATASAAWFWKWRGLNEFADEQDFIMITKRINGGLIGIESRTAFWEIAKQVIV